MLEVLLGTVILVNGLFAYRFVRDYLSHKEETWREPGNTIFLAIFSVIVWFLSTFGISDFAISTVVYRFKRLVEDKRLPGTLNAQCVIPVAVMALAYLSSIKCDSATLVVCIIAQVLGSYLAPRFVVKLPVKILRIGMGCGLLVATGFILVSKLHLMPSGGTAVGLEGTQLVIACVTLFIYGALNNVGIGSYAPTMATIYALGLNPSVAFPIMMGACALSVPVGSMEFVRLGEYNRKPTVFGATVGILGVLCAVFLITNLNIAMLQWVVAFVVCVAGINLLYDAFKESAGTTGKAID